MAIERGEPRERRLPARQTTCALGRSGDAFLLPMSREDIGSYLHLVIETVSRTLTKMQEEGLIAVRAREVRIVDREGLDRLAHETAEK